MVTAAVINGEAVEFGIYDRIGQNDTDRAQTAQDGLFVPLSQDVDSGF